MTEKMTEDKVPKEKPKLPRLPREEPLKSHLILNLCNKYFVPPGLLIIIYFVHYKFETYEMLVTILALIASCISLCLTYKFENRINNREKNNNNWHRCEKMTEEKVPKKTPKLPSEEPLKLDLITSQNTDQRELKNRRN